MDHRTQLINWYPVNAEERECKVMMLIEEEKSRERKVADYSSPEWKPRRGELTF